MLHGVQRQPNVLFPGALPLASAGVGGYIHLFIIITFELYVFIYTVGTYRDVTYMSIQYHTISFARGLCALHGAECFKDLPEQMNRAISREVGC